ncbi:MAG TPA: hypothetical protein VGF90_04215 [Verrucomicrobiae bacterium]
MNNEARAEAEARLRELGIDPGETYEGPNPDNVTPFPTEAVMSPPPPPAPVMNRAQYVETLTAALNVLSARFLGAVAVIGAVAMFGWAVYDPLPWRLAAVGTYAAVVLWPIVWLYLRRG